MADPTTEPVASTAGAPPAAAVAQRRPGRMLLISGLAMAAAGVIAYVLQVSSGRLFAPWYMPCLATAGTILVLLSLWQARSLGRFIALALVVLLTVGEWTLLSTLTLPSYTGPVISDKPFPEFTTKRADGSSFTRSDLTGQQKNVLVFFRGRW